MLNVVVKVRLIVSVKMSGECDKCGEHALECVCVLHSFDCECEVCKDKWEKAQAAIDAIYMRVPIDLSFDIPKLTSIARIEHNVKYLENQQRLKNLADMDKSVTPPSSTVTTLKK